MGAFLSDQWFEELNTRLATSPAAPWPDEARGCRVVLDVADAPANFPTALTLTITDERVSVAPGALPDADTVLRLAYADAAALAAGTLDSASALREGRIKVRGDVNVLVPLSAWLLTVLTG